MRTNLGTKNGNPDTDAARRFDRLERAIQQIPSRFGQRSVGTISDRFETSTNISDPVGAFTNQSGWSADSPSVIPSTVPPPGNFTTDGTTFTCASAGYYRITCQLSAQLSIQVNSGGFTTVSGPYIEQMKLAYPAQVAVSPLAMCTLAFWQSVSIAGGTTFPNNAFGLYVFDEVYFKESDTFTVQRKADISNVTLSGGGSFTIGTTTNLAGIMTISAVPTI